MADLRTDIVAGDIGHPGIHNATNAAVNALSDTVSALVDGSVGYTPTVGMSGDQLTIDGVVTGPHLTGPQGAGAFTVYPAGTDTSGFEVGTVYGLYDLAATAAPTVRGWATGHLESLTTFTVTPGSPGGFQTDFGGVVPQAGDLVIVSMLVKDPSTYPGLSWTAPAGFTQLPTIDAQGTMQPWIWIGTATGSGAMSWVSSVTASAQYAAIWISGAATPGDVVQGTIKRRTTAPAETTTVTCPSVAAPGFSLAVALAFERTAAAEATAPAWSSGWTPTIYGPESRSDGTNDLLTTCVAVKTMATAGATGDATITYPNAQANNGLGVQLIVPGAMS